MMRSAGRLIIGLSLCVLLPACTKTPEGVRPVTGFELERYLGKWYEIARLDHPFERGLQRVTAEYSLLDDNGIKVVNRGYDPGTGKWREAVGKAYFIDGPDTGSLRVSFFGPFYGGYHIIALDKESYRYAMVSGPSRDYLWILSRTPAPGEDLISSLTDEAADLGFPVDGLIRVKHGDRD